MQRKWTLSALAALALGILLALAGCFSGGTSEPGGSGDEMRAQAADGTRPRIPEKLDLDEGVPRLIVFDTGTDSYQNMDIERYVAGVLAGEMRGDWPMEALKAQAILARTYTLKFVNDKQSRYEGADISTDVKEAQAYDAGKINERIEKAVEETRGQVLSAGGELPYAWFHAHSGGRTDLATKALDFDGAEPSYTRSVPGEESDLAPTTVKHWTARFTAQEVGEAAAKAGVKTGKAVSIEIGERSEAGRAVTLNINGKSVSAPALRVNLDSAKMKSTLLTEASCEGDTVTFSGMGYGHGVGMSQWGAYGLAQRGEDAQEIIDHFFQGVDVVKLWD